MAACRSDADRRFPFPYVKQLGSLAVARNDSERDDLWPGASVPWDDRHEPSHQGEVCPLRLNHLKGADPTEWPEGLRFTVFPELVYIKLFRMAVTRRSLENSPTGNQLTDCEVRA